MYLCSNKYGLIAMDVVTREMGPELKMQICANLIECLVCVP